MLAQQVCRFTVPISDLNVVIPVEAGEMAVKPSVREMLQDARNKHKPLYICIFHTTSSRQVPGTPSLTPHHRPPIHFLPFFCLFTFKSLLLLLLPSLRYCTHIQFNFRANVQNLGHNLPPFPQDSFSMGAAQIQLSWGYSLPLPLSLSATVLLSTAPFIPLFRWDLAKHTPSIKQIVNVQTM